MTDHYTLRVSLDLPGIAYDAGDGPHLITLPARSQASVTETLRTIFRDGIDQAVIDGDGVRVRRHYPPSRVLWVDVIEARS
jgi:hypothetical protein